MRSPRSSRGVAAKRRATLHSRCASEPWCRRGDAIAPRLEFFDECLKRRESLVKEGVVQISDKGQASDNQRNIRQFAGINFLKKPAFGERFARLRTSRRRAVAALVGGHTDFGRLHLKI
jgi:hypothetical protein